MTTNFYEHWILPPILDLIMRQEHLTKYRRAVVAGAHGRVLEVGVGSGLNFPLYGKQVELVCGIDPSPRLLAIAHRRAAASGVPVELLQGSASSIPLADNAVDTVVMTWTLCSFRIRWRRCARCGGCSNQTAISALSNTDFRLSQVLNTGSTGSLRRGAGWQAAAIWTVR